MEIIERKFAQESGLKTYFTGKLCKKGHVSYRYTKSGACAECINGSSRFTDLRQTGLPPELVTLEREVRVRNRTKEMEAAFILREKHEERVASTEAVNAESARLKAERETILPLLAGKRFLIAHDRDWVEMRNLTILMTKMEYPCLSDLDISPHNSCVRWDVEVGRHTVHTAHEIWAIVNKISWAKLQARDTPVVPPTFGLLTRETVPVNFNMTTAPSRTIIEDTIPSTEIAIGGCWYRKYELAALIAGRRPSIEPVPS